MRSTAAALALDLAEFLEADVDYSQYQDDPVRFGEEVLGESYTDDVKRIFESIRDNEITMCRSANATGKSHCGGAIAHGFYKIYPDAQVYVAAAPPESNLRKILWGEIARRVDDQPDLFKSDRVAGLHIERTPQSFITGVTIPSSGTESQREAKFSGKHAPNLLFIIDEGDAVPDEVYRGIESCMSGGNARLLVFFNPRHQSGAPYRMERDGTANVVHLSAFKHPNVVEGKDIIPGAVTRTKTVRRINEWTRPLAPNEKPDHECYKLPDFLVGATAKKTGGGEYPPLKAGYYRIINPAFSYMVLGEYPAQAVDQVISREWIARARQRWDVYVSEHGEMPTGDIQGVVGLDIGEYGTDETTLCFRWGGFVQRLVSWLGMDPDTTIETAAKEIEARESVKTALVDAIGVGSGVAPGLRKRHKVDAYPVKVSESPTYETELGRFERLRDQLWWSVREWLRADPAAMLPPDENLVEELIVPTYEVRNGKIKVMDKDTMRELLGRSPDKADSLCLTFAPQERAFSPLNVEKCFV